MSAFRYAFALLLLAGTASAGTVPEPDAQGLLVGSAGRTLYSYDPDGTSGISHCDGPCAAVWPPYAADAGSTANGGYALAKRADGSLQWVYQGRPLYLFAGDTQPGDRGGDGVNGTWHVVH